MLEGGKISSRQALFINITLVIGTAWLGVAALVTAYAKQDAWISILLTTFLGLPIAWLIAKLGSLFPGKTLIEYLVDILGYWPGKILGLLYLFWFVHICSIMVREYGTFLASVFLIDTPMMVIDIVVLLISAYIIRLGLEVLARTIEFFFPWIIFLVVSMFLLAIPEMELSRLLPVLDTNFIDIFKGSLSPTAWMGEIVTFAIFIPYLAKPEKAMGIAIGAIIFLIGTFLLLVIGSLLTFGSNIASINYPILNVARVINIAQTLDRLEPIIVIIWVTGGLLKIAIFYYVIVLGSAQWMSLKNYRPLIMPIGIILLTLSIAVVDNVLELNDFLAHYWPFYAIIPFEFGLPVMLFLIALIKRKGFL